MLDYRNSPEESPVVWSPQLGKLVPSAMASSVMRTVFHIDEMGIFPYGVIDVDKWGEEAVVAVS